MDKLNYTKIKALYAPIAGGTGLILGWGTKIPHVQQHGQINKQNKTKQNSFSGNVTELR